MQWLQEEGAKIVTIKFSAENILSPRKWQRQSVMEMK